ncbi:hypothetical protein QJS04_geneDACA006817 [Acorus gramineus]|uniref:Uncharacterized protein n=1 Tax=Acorus gramineus TaxID=55184 RepID=A0AAV9AYW1_ACOGR|nr:hypothetical protein QJS04_geneDACA006817 [Acorus gramineus]
MRSHVINSNEFNASSSPPAHRIKRGSWSRRSKGGEDLLQVEGEYKEELSSC